ncbi:MAG: urate oxidase [Candidatus Acidiferrales bacterium]
MMRIRLGQNNYGKSRVRMLRLSRQERHHEIKELTLEILFEGDFDRVHTEGDNAKILPTDTIKNTVYVLAKQYPPEPMEEFAEHLIEHFLTYNPQVSRVKIACSEHPWNRITVGDKPHATSFIRAGNETRTAVVTGTREETRFAAGIHDLAIMKTAGSAFEGFVRDPYTSLKSTMDRILMTNVRAEWHYAAEEVAFSPIWHGVRQTLLETFAGHDSRSVQHTLYAMGEAVLKSFEPISEIRLAMPNKHYNLADLTPFGMENENEIFVPTDEPHGMIEATLRKDV